MMLFRRLKLSRYICSTGDIEGTTTEIVDSNDRVLRAVESVCQRGDSRFIDHAKSVKTCSARCVCSIF